MAMEPHYWVSDLARSEAFYRDALGFEVTARFPREGAPTWCALRLGEATVMLAAGGSAPRAEDDPRARAMWSAAVARVGTGGAVSVHVPVPDVAAHHARAAKAGARVVEPLRDTLWGYRQYTVEDPDGHWLTFHQSR